MLKPYIARSVNALSGLLSFLVNAGRSAAWLWRALLGNRSAVAPRLIYLNRAARRAFGAQARRSRRAQRFTRGAYGYQSRKFTARVLTHNMEVRGYL